MRHGTMIVLVADIELLFFKTRWKFECPSHCLQLWLNSSNRQAGRADLTGPRGAAVGLAIIAESVSR